MDLGGELNARQEENKSIGQKENSQRLLSKTRISILFAGYTDGGFLHGITWSEDERTTRRVDQSDRSRGRTYERIEIDQAQFQEIVDAYEICT
ncbi:hypothetical protein VQ056_13935 [Paenibacillus sp. JTLBN-2024]